MRDYRPDKEASFRSFAELCITRQIITAIKSATRYKHSPLNGYVSFSQTPAGHDEAMDCTLGDSLPGPSVDDPSRRVIATQELGELICVLGTALSRLESQVLTLYLEGRSYEEIGAHVECDPKAVDNALQRVKRKVGIHLGERATSTVIRRCGYLADHRHRRAPDCSRCGDRARRQLRLAGAALRGARSSRSTATW